MECVEWWGQANAATVKAIAAVWIHETTSTPVRGNESLKNTRAWFLDVVP